MAQIEQTHHIGELRSDSPGLYRTLLRRMGKEGFARVERAYAEAARCGALEEAPVLRDPGASFNPKPARICQILVAELSEFRELVLSASMLSCVSPEKMVPIPLLSEEQAVALLVHEWLSGKHRRSTSVVVERISLALKLDQLRHLHMTGLDLDGIRRVYSEVTMSLLPSVSYPENVRLKTLLETCVMRFEQGERKSA